MDRAEFGVPHAPARFERIEVARLDVPSLGFGRYPGIATPFLPGAIDEVRLYARALTAAEVLTLFESPGSDPGSGSKGKGRMR